MEYKIKLNNEQFLLADKGRLMFLPSLISCTDKDYAVFELENTSLYTGKKKIVYPLFGVLKLRVCYDGFNNVYTTYEEKGGLLHDWVVTVLARGSGYNEVMNFYTDVLKGSIISEGVAQVSFNLLLFTSYRLSEACFRS